MRSQPASSPIFPGQIIVHTLRLAPLVRITWVTEISQVVPRQMFVDQQKSGPFKFWRHQHRFKVHGEGVEMEDEVHYALPMGWLGHLAHGLFARHQVKSTFDFRKRRFEEIFGDCSAPQAMEGR